MEDELNKAHEYIQNIKYWHLGALTALAQKLIKEGRSNEAKIIKDAVDFVDKNLK